MKTQQKFYGERSLIFILALLSAFPPLSTDLYLPALPTVMDELAASQTQANLSLSLFLVAFALGILIWGPISEKVGRKPILLAGLALYTIGGAGCAVASNIHMLVLARIFQGFGGGAAEAVVTAMVKDMFSGKKRESVLAVIMAMVVVAPVVAPVAGAFTLQFMSWKAIFWVLTVVGVVSFLLSLLLSETVETRYTGSLLQSLGRLGVVLKNPGFSLLLGLFSLVPLPLLAFIGSSSFVYINKFGMTAQTYSYYFAVNAIGSLFGPLLYIKLSKRFLWGHIITCCLVVIAICGVLLMGFGNNSPELFAAPMLIATIAMSMMRPPTANLLLSQQDGDTGSAASLINFMALLMGGFGMFIISLEHVDRLVTSLGLMLLVIGTFCCLGWLILKKRPFIRKPH